MIQLTDITIRNAGPADAEVICELVTGLAHYEELQDSNLVTPDALRSELAREHPTLQAVLAEHGEQVVGMATFFETYSTFASRCGMYIEDIFVAEAFRHQGIGTQIFRHLARMAAERDYGRIEWACLLWNTSAIEFYESLGARPSDVWSTYRLSGEWLEKLATET